MKRRRLVLLSLAVASLALVAGTGAFTAMSADRGVDVRVAADDSAYIQVEQFPNNDTSATLTLSNNETPKWITLIGFENNIPGDSVDKFEVELRSGEDHPAKVMPGGGQGNYDIRTPWHSGNQSGDLKANINCGQQGTNTLTFDINLVTDGGVSVTLTRSVGITCTNPSPTETATETETNVTTSESQNTTTNGSESS